MRLEDLVADTLQAAAHGVSADADIVEYVSNILRNGLAEEEDARELLDAAIGVAPDLERLFTPSHNFDIFLVRASEMEKRMHTQQVCSYIYIESAQTVSFQTVCRYIESAQSSIRLSVRAYVRSYTIENI